MSYPAASGAQSPASKPLRVGIIGCGKIAINHVHALQAIEGVEVSAVVDVDAQRARAFADAYGIRHAFDDVDAMLSSGIEVATVCTPHPAHEANVLAAARHGVHVLCEKPIAVDLDQADRMIAATDAAGVRFGVVFQRRFWPAAQRIRAAIDEGRMTAPITGSVIARFRRDAEYYAEPWRGRWDTEGGGVLINQAIHHVDLLLWFMGPAKRVFGRIATLAHGEFIEVEDTAVATIEFESGALATIHASTTFDPGHGVQVLVSDRAGNTASVLEFPEGTGLTDVWSVGDEREYRDPYADAFRAGQPFDIPIAEIHGGLVPYHALQIAEFIDAVRNGREPVVTGREARKSLAVIAAIYESSKTGMPIDLAATRSAGANAVTTAA
ncbi:Gfo/Idh/MocA family protein [Ruicaihuangia caeni]|uniref:Gfo/Idh/MocA family oxidoreductase n=1 Tax=Ruicaihuangia caeni TaxID=3042517 RepID=A0AAW6T599_9MICO|nr:Gfo/Idh/MocA family oxidoreductase [Klugiella sp. YN-L-19]MDI2099005.1 Gfo/Idh/MocA family oxidoreductase [Klugiella sp. YN-L-19]